MGTPLSPGEWSEEALADTRWFKVTTPDGRPLHGGSGVWSLPKGRRPGRYWAVKGPLYACQSGLHLTDRRHLEQWLPEDKAFTVWEAEVAPGSSRVDDFAKVCVRKARLVRPVATVREDEVAAWKARWGYAKRYIPAADALLHLFRWEADRPARDAARAEQERVERERWGEDFHRPLVFGRDRANGDIWCPAWPKDLGQQLERRTIRRGCQMLGLKVKQERFLAEAIKHGQGPVALAVLGLPGVIRQETAA